MDPVQVFWCEPSGKVRRFFGCYEVADTCTGGGYCQAQRLIDEVDAEWEEHEDGKKYRKRYDEAAYPWDAFPRVCDRCGREFQNPTRQIFVDEIFVVKTGTRAGELFARKEAPVGAMWDIEYYRDIPEWCGRDGIALTVVVPGGEWHVDGRANNCTMPSDSVHRCWVRHGDPRQGYVHVDKDGTPEHPTCQAGAGSIWMRSPDGWHGFLHRGYLVDCDKKHVVDAMLEAATPRVLPAAQRVLKPHQVDRPPAPPPPLRPNRLVLRSNRGFQARPKR